MRTANVLMSVMLSDKLTDQDKKELFAKIQNPEAYCSSAGCMLPRKHTPRKNCKSGSGISRNVSEYEVICLIYEQSLT
jgi:hypothetical protein